MNKIIILILSMFTISTMYSMSEHVQEIDLLMNSDQSDSAKKAFLEKKLGEAYLNNNIELTKLLIHTHGEWIDHPCRPSTLRFAVQNGFIEILKIAFSHRDANPLEKPCDEPSLLEVAKKTGNLETINILKAAQQWYLTQVEVKETTLKQEISQLKEEIEALKLRYTQLTKQSQNENI